MNGDGHSDVIIGAWNFENGVGRAYLYRGSPSGLESTASWAESESWVQSEFGTSVSTAGDVNGDGYSDVVIGAPYYGLDFQGRAFVYLGSASGLGANPASFVSGQEASALLGRQVATAGDVDGDGFSDVMVVANGAGGHSRAYVHRGSVTGLGATAAWSTITDQSNAGLSLSTAGDVNGDGYSDVILGMSGYDNGQSNEGRAYVYHGSASGLAASSAWNKESNQAGAQLGISVATAGDVNGDGYSDVILGAHAYDGGQADEGRAFVHHGSPSGPSATASWTAESNQESAYLGISVATAGDVNADGYSDVIVGAYFHDDGEADEGGAYVYHGSASGLGASAAWSAQSDQAGGWLGDSVSSAGDVNGDGYGDVVVGAPGYDGGQAEEGRAYVYHGSPSGLAASPAWWAESDQAGALFGEAVSTAGDANGDGYSDVIIGASSFDAGAVDEGRAFLYLGSPSGLASNAAWTAESDQANARFGYSLATAGDVNGDGYSDTIVGAYAFDNGQTDEGRAFVYQGSSSGLLANAAWTAEADQDSAYFGFSVSTAGDVNGDGYSDVVVGAVWYDNGESNEGRAVVYHGSATGLAASAAWTAESNQASALLGNSVSTAGDVNGDGYSDVVVGAPYFDGGEGDEGRVWIYLGNDGRGGPLRGLQQRTSDGQVPLPLLGRTGASGAFRIHGELAPGVAGASTARLEWEVKPLGIPFNGQGIESGAPLSGPGGGPLIFDESVSPSGSHHLFSARAGTYRWRVRVATDDPLYPHTPWFSVPGNALTEAKLRKSAFRFP